jgi:fatty-acyl-CoA synthase
MRLLFAGDSRMMHPLLRPGGDHTNIVNYYSDLLDTFISSNSLHHEIFGYIASPIPGVTLLNPSAFNNVERVFIFTLALLYDRYLAKNTEHFDLAIVMSGWHDWVCPWAEPMWKELAGNDFNADNYVEHFETGAYRYIDKAMIAKCVKKLKEVSTHQLFVGMHGIKRETQVWGPTIHKPQYQHHVDALEMNDFFSSLDVDYLHLPLDYKWLDAHVRPSCGIHYVEKGAQWMSARLNNYIDILDKGIFSTIEKNGAKTNKLIVVDGCEIHYDELIRNSLKVGSYLSATLKPKSIVLISKKTSLEQLYVFLGCLAYGLIPIVIQHPNTKVTNEQLKKKLEHIKMALKPDLCVCDEAFLDVYKDFFHSISCFKEVEICQRPTINPDDTAFMQLSSGTTGLPKVMEVTHKKLLWHIHEYSKFIQFAKDDVVCSWLPLYHDMGLIACFMMPAVVGSSFVHINNFEWLSKPESLFESIAKYGGTHIWMPNFAFAHMKKTTCNVSLDSVKQFISCSECTRMQDMQSFASTFKVDIAKFRNCYALAENVFAVSQSSGLSEKDGIVSCGAVLPGVSVMIFDNGKDITDEGTGKVYIKSFYEPKANKHSEFGYYDTGDIGYIENRQLYIIGRDVDRIKSFGSYVFPYPIEDYISANVPEVLSGRVACLGVPDDRIGTEKVFVCAESEENDLDNKIKTKIMIAIKEAFDVAVTCVIVPPGWLIKTSSGKLERVAIRKKMIHESLQTTDGQNAYDFALDVVKRIFTRKQINIELIAEEIDLHKLLDSLELLEIFLALERFGVKLGYVNTQDAINLKMLRDICQK